MFIFGLYLQNMRLCCGGFVGVRAVDDFFTCCTVASVACRVASHRFCESSKMLCSILLGRSCD